MVRVTYGRVFDVAVDIRRESKDFGRWVGVYLCAEKKQQLWIPSGFAHGFLVLSDVAEFQYKASNYYSPSHERSIMYNDKDINIKWPSLETEYILNKKDKSAQSLKNVK